MPDYLFYAMFTATKQGKTGLTPTCTVYRASDGTVVANAQAATEVGGGLYRYSHTNATEGDYLGVFVTANITVDFQHVAALASVAVPRIDAAVSTRSTLTAQNVWEYATRTLSSFGELVANIWAAPVRTLTMTAPQIAAVIAGANITAPRGDTWSISLTDLGALTGYVSIDFTLKTYASATDSEATARVRRNASGTNDGLLTLNGATGTALQGAIAIDSQANGDITLTLAAAATAQIEPGSYIYDVQIITATSVHTLTQGEFTVTKDVTRAVI